MTTPVNTRNHEFNATAKACGLSAEELLALKDRFEVAGWVWQRLGDRIQCGNGRSLWTADRAELLAQVSADGIEVAELRGEEAAEVLSDFAGLSLVPIERDEWHTKLTRAGFTPGPSTRHAMREGAKGGVA